MISGFIDENQTLRLMTSNGYVQLPGAPVLAYIEMARMFAENRGDQYAYYGDVSRYDAKFRDGIEELKRITDFFSGLHLSRNGMTAVRFAARIMGFMPDEMECSKPNAGRCPCGENECYCVPRHMSQYGSSCARCGTSMKRVVPVPRDQMTEAWVEHFTALAKNT